MMQIEETTSFHTGGMFGSDAGWRQIPDASSWSNEYVDWFQDTVVIMACIPIVGNIMGFPNAGLPAWIHDSDCPMNLSYWRARDDLQQSTSPEI